MPFFLVLVFLVGVPLTAWNAWHWMCAGLPVWAWALGSVMALSAALSPWAARRGGR